ncbi:DUF6578 domain-containing protein [Solwaraspora sp. WMMD792]|uniref:DUF6578 domain-containing protein n=1 Tax=Solwaraspora sp. WMMD792 TaxID=3016099 RepID=UPI002417F1A5|nr:DUF6578 domain-containing protein [Solwaraspora sp. WMMD792]MDG4772993.1 hypothetical protein [Solwaraspora sp. WMMD792]
MEKTVWLDSWQMQCCGEPFALGDEVAWTLHDPNVEWLSEVLGADLAGRVDAAEEHHGGVAASVSVTVGTVASIQTAHCRYAPHADGPDNYLYPVPGSGAVSAVSSADGWPPESEDLRFVGYVVQLTGVRTRPA